MADALGNRKAGQPRRLEQPQSAPRHLLQGLHTSSDVGTRPARPTPGARPAPAAPFRPTARALLGAAAGPGVLAEPVAAPKWALSGLCRSATGGSPSHSQPLLCSCRHPAAPAGCSSGAEREECCGQLEASGRRQLFLLVYWAGRSTHAKVRRGEGNHAQAGAAMHTPHAAQHAYACPQSALTCG